MKQSRAYFWKCAGLLCLALILGYGTELAPYYVSAFYPNELKVLGPVTRFEQPCTEAVTKYAYCSHKYVIPKELLKAYPGEVLGAGQLVSATVYSCGKQTQNSVVFDDPKKPGRLLQTLKIYQTVDLSLLDCRDNDLSIETWSVFGSHRSGYIGGMAVIGSRRSVERVKRLSEFFAIDFIQLLGFVYLLLFAFSKILSGLLGTGIRKTPFEKFLWAWFGFIITSSGLLQIVLPLTQYSNLFDRLSCLFSIICRGTVIFVAVSQTPRLSERLKRYFTLPIHAFAPLRAFPVFGYFALLIACSPDFIRYFGPTMLLMSGGTLLGALILRDTVVTCFGIAFLIESLKILGLPFLPQSQVATIFVGFVLGLETVERFRSGVGLLKISRDLRDPQFSRKVGDTFDQVLATIANHIGCKRVALLSLRREGGGCRIRTCSKEGSENRFLTYDRNELPPVFAHAISTGREIIHLDDRTELFENIRRGNPQPEKYGTHYHCVVPLFGESRAVGGLAFTEYPEEWADDANKTLELETIIRLLKPTLLELLINEDLLASKDWSDSIREAIDHLSSNVMSDSRTGLGTPLLQKSIEVIASRLDAYGYIAKLDDASRLYKIEGITGYPEDIFRILVEGKLYALRENEQGPLALAVNRKKVIVVPDVSLLRSVLHRNTNAFFERCGTRSCVAIPIFKSESHDVFSSDEVPVWGVLFLEKNRGEPFTLQSVRGLEQIAKAVSALLYEQDQQALLGRTREILSSFMPSHVFHEMLKNGIERESDRGYLVKLDLRRSSAIALEIGSRNWENKIRLLLPELIKVSQHHGLTLQEFEWDAGWLTLSADTPSIESLQNIVRCCSDVVPIIDYWYEENFSALCKMFGEDKRRARFCISFGDTSRGLSLGANRRWTIIGSEMGLINKFEDQCKKLPAVIYADSSVEARANSDLWINTRERIAGTEREILFLDIGWSDLIDDSLSRKKAG